MSENIPEKLAEEFSRTYSETAPDVFRYVIAETLLAAEDALRALAKGTDESARRVHGDSDLRSEIHSEAHGIRIAADLLRRIREQK